MKRSSIMPSLLIVLLSLQNISCLTSPKIESLEESKIVPKNVIFHAAKTVWFADRCSNFYPDLKPRFLSAIDAIKELSKGLVPADAWSADRMGQKIVEWHNSFYPVPTKEKCIISAKYFQSYSYQETFMVYIKSLYKYQPG